MNKLFPNEDNFFPCMIFFSASSVEKKKYIAISFKQKEIYCITEYICSF